MLWQSVPATLYIEQYTGQEMWQYSGLQQIPLCLRNCCKLPSTKTGCFSLTTCCDSTKKTHIMAEHCHRNLPKSSLCFIFVKIWPEIRLIMFWLWTWAVGANVCAVNFGRDNIVFCLRADTWFFFSQEGEWNVCVLLWYIVNGDICESNPVQYLNMMHLYKL